MNEKRFLAKYRPEDFARPSVAVDVVVLTVKDQSLCVLLVQRNEHPFKGRWALPGGFLRVGPSAKEQGEDLDAAAARELEEETGLGRKDVFLDQLRAFGDSGRDPRMRVVSIAYFALVRPDLLPRVRPGGDASRVRWMAIDDALLDRAELAFDHRAILAAAVEHVRARLETTAISQSLVPDTFTIPELRAAFEIVTGNKLDR
ncbi:MAG TPA: NUDIX domain-containing protein, partial [Polyangiaceae bacterium]